MARFSAVLGIASERASLVSLALLVCSATFAVPFTAVPIELQKGIIAALLLGFFLVFLAVSILLGRVQPKFSGGVILSFVSVFVSYVLIFGWWHAVSGWQLFGLGFEVGTAGFFVLFGTLVFAGATLAYRYVGVGIVLWIAASALAGCTTLLLYIFGVRGEGFTTLLGTWPQLSFLLASGLLVALVSYDSAPKHRHFYRFAIIILALLFGCFFHSGAALALLSVFIVFALYTYWDTRRIPVLTCIASLVLIAALMVGATPWLEMPSDMRLSFFLNEIILAHAYVSDPSVPMFGVGPGNFSELWEAYRPNEFNATPLWDRAFTEGYSTISTFFVEIGFFGVLSFLLSPIALLVYVYRERLHSKEKNVNDTNRITVALFGTYVFVAAFLYTVHITLFLGAALALGVWAYRPSNVAESNSLRVRFLAGTPLGVLGVFLVLIASFQGMAAHQYIVGTTLSQEERFAEASETLEYAVALWPASLYHRDLSRALLEEAATLAAVESPEFKSLAAKAVTHADTAALLAPKDYWNWISKSSVYVSLYSFGFVELEEETDVALTQARLHSPSRPEPLYLMSVFAFTRENVDESHRYIDEALTLKPDYQEALAFKARIRDTTLQ